LRIARRNNSYNQPVLKGQPSVTSNMVGKKSGKALLREEGLERTDNGMKQSSWPDVPMINQKNYYTYVSLLEILDVHAQSIHPLQKAIELHLSRSFFLFLRANRLIPELIVGQRVYEAR
jgi:hypothetical protein